MHARPVPVPAKYPPHVRLLDVEVELFCWINREDLIGPYLMVKRDCISQSFCWTKPETWAKETGRHVATIRRRIEQLEEAGVIQRKRTLRGMEYHLTIPEVVALYGAQTNDKAAREERKAARKTRVAARCSYKNQVNRELIENEPPPTPRPEVVVSEEILGTRPEGLERQLTPAEASKVASCAPERVEKALAYVKARKARYPADYFLKALDHPEWYEVSVQLPKAKATRAVEHEVAMIRGQITVWEQDPATWPSKQRDIEQARAQLAALEMQQEVRAYA